MQQNDSLVNGQVGHLVLFDRGHTLRPMVTLTGEENVARPGPLAPRTTYRWQVVAQMADGTERAGPVWIAIDETAILLTLPSPSLLTHLLKGEGVQQNDSLVNGQVWSFTTGNRRSCTGRNSSTAAAPPPAHSKPTPASCSKALDECCGPAAAAAGKRGGNVKGLGDLCVKHMRRHNASLADPESGCGLLDEQRYCDPCGRGFPFCDPTCQGLTERNGVPPLLPGCCWPGAPNPPCCAVSPIPPDCCGHGGM